LTSPTEEKLISRAFAEKANTKSRGKKRQSARSLYSGEKKYNVSMSGGANWQGSRLN